MLCINYRKRLKPRLQTFETFPANVCVPRTIYSFLEDDAKTKREVGKSHTYQLLILCHVTWLHMAAE